MKAETYFEIHGTPPEIQVRLARLSMGGVVQHWFSIVEEVYESLTWSQLKQELLQRFSGLEIQNPFEQLSTLLQSGSVQKYIEDFEYLLSLVPRQTESQALGYFLGGLRDEIRKKFRPHRPATRLAAMYLAKDIEDMLYPSEFQFSSRRLRSEQSVEGGAFNKSNGLPSYAQPTYSTGYNPRPDYKMGNSHSQHNSLTQT